MVLNLLLAALLAGCVHAGKGPGPAEGVPVAVEREAYLMGTVLRARVEAADREVGIAALEAGLAEVRRLDGVLSSWRPESELGRLNAAPVGEPVEVSAELWGLLEEARGWSERTGGGFDPAVGSLVDAWGIRGEGRRPAEAELEAARGAAGWASFAFDEVGRTVTRRSGRAWLDSGGFGKGAALRSMAAVLRGAGVRSASLDFGGQLLVYGAPPEGRGGWEVEVAHPSRRGEGVERLVVREGSVSTSAQSERFVEVDGARYGHVLDPRSGLPVPAWGSVTVVAGDAVVADVLSTALLVMGPEAARRWAAGAGEVGVLVLEERDGQVMATANAAMARYRIDNDDQSKDDDER